jgi:SAM-dependent methyltransferase
VKTHSSRTEIHKKWQQTALVYQERADEYDSWYDNSLLFEIELAALQQISGILPEPELELGAGPGRFASRLGVSLAIDPAPAALRHGLARGIAGVAGIGEQLPVRSGSVGTVFILFTLCFLVDPARVLQECHRILRPDGRLVIGQIPQQSAWGQLLAQKKAEGNLFYQYADFYTIAASMALLQQSGFTLLESFSTLYQSPEQLAGFERPKPGDNEEAGFCVLVSEKQ